MADMINGPFYLDYPPGYGPSGQIYVKPPPSVRNSAEAILNAWDKQSDTGNIQRAFRKTTLSKGELIKFLVALVDD